jgi:hypothetical protein
MYSCQKCPSTPIINQDSEPGLKQPVLLSSIVLLFCTKNHQNPLLEAKCVIKNIKRLILAVETVQQFFLTDGEGRRDVEMRCPQ